ncbi:unnamed protein product [Moneuplotes crassus]|uniref:Uncharacterized protein n=1 Tax=Euplotes crassus TaxID=5936 RepID=A0AAD1Y5W7_EUPCR|nr:unnamed protein product [Moneuplotes crassus]
MGTPTEERQGHISTEECDEGIKQPIRGGKELSQIFIQKEDDTLDCTPTFSDMDENFSSFIGMPSLTVNTSLTFKKPTNEEFKGIFEELTQCDSINTDSEGEHLFDEAQCLMDEEEYVELMERTFFLVKDSLDRRFRPLLSPTLLKNKMYRILQQRPSLVEQDILFEEGALEKSTTIKRTKSLPMNRLWRKISPKFRSRKTRFDARSKVFSSRKNQESQISYLFKFLEKD